MIRPFRLINALELKELTEHFNSELENWNNQYALTPFSTHLEKPVKNKEMSDVWRINDEDHCIAIINKPYLETLNQVLFGENNSCFDSYSQDFLLILLNKLFKTKQCALEKAHEPICDWVYNGSTCLQLILNSASHQLGIVLSPDWVYKSIKINPIKKNNLNSLDEALAEEIVTLNLELIPMRFPIQQLNSIQIGDVLVTDHSISTPLKILRQKQVLAEAELGQSEYYNSIIIKEFQ